MFCTNCGTQLNDDAMFCTSCGAKIQREETSATMPASAEAAVPPSEAPTPNRKPIIIAAIVLACVAIALIAVMFACSQAQRHERTHAAVAVPVTIAFSTEGPNNPIGVPLIIEGTDLDNKHVEQLYLSPASGGTVELAAGSYSVRVAGPMPNTSGQVYKDQDANAYALEIPVPDEDGDEQPATETQPDINITLVSVAPQDLTEDEIQKIKDWTTEFDVDPNEAAQAIEAVIRVRDQEIARANLEKEKQAALNANPSMLTGNGTETISGVTLTGTVRKGTFTGKSNSVKDIVYLQLPSKISIEKVRYPAYTAYQTEIDPIDGIELGDSFLSYIGKTVTISGDITIQFTPGPSVSWVYFTNASVTRVFE